jgi:putative ABC transport system permease protein
MYERIYRLLLRLYPAPFREDYEREILLVFRSQLLSEKHIAGRLAFMAVAAAGIFLNAPKEHLSMLMTDLKYALRTFRRNPWFTFVALATLAWGIGVNSALFSVVKPVLLDSLPYRRPEQLVRVWVRNPTQGFDHDVTSWPRFQDWKARSKGIHDFAGFTSAKLILTGVDKPLQMQGAMVTANFLGLCGVTPVLGRDFEYGDDQLGRPRKVILGHGLWLRRFGADPAIIGRQLTLSGESYTVAGVLPESFRLPERDLDFWIPLTVDRHGQQDRGSFWLNVIGRLKDGVPLSRAQAEMDSIASALATEFLVDKHLGVTLVGLQDDLTGPIRSSLLILTGAVAFLLLICCANIAGMLSARAADRGRELAIRTALGAGRRRMVRQLLTEALLLFCIGGALGIGVAYAGVILLLRLAPADVPQLQDTHLDLAVVAFSLAVSAASGLLFGLWPAVQASRFDVSAGLKQGGRGLTSRTDGRRFRSSLTIGEIALSMILLTGGWLLVRSLQRIEDAPLGFDTQRVAMARIQLPRTKYPAGKTIVAFYQGVLDGLKNSPGIESATAISTFFLGRLPDAGIIYIEGRQQRVYTPLTTDSVTPEFFSAMKIPLLKGRFFDQHDRAGAPLVAIVNETTARRYWPNEDPIGKRFTFDERTSAEAQWSTIVGVVADTRRAGVEQPVFTESYSPLAQVPSRSMFILMRAARGTIDARTALETAIRQQDRQQPLAKFTSLDTALGDRVATRRFTTFLLTLFAAAALAIAGVGVYGLISYLVSQRRQEFGVRVALGAQPLDLLRMVLGRVMVLAAAGLGLGLIGALILTKGLQSFLFEVTRFDTGSYLAAGVVLALACLVAAAAPAIRATKADPLTALRAE